MRERRLHEQPSPDEPVVVRGEDELPRMPPGSGDPYRPHMRDRQPWASRRRILVWAWIPVVLIVFGVVLAHYY